jgi:hypothetical protein
MQNRPLKFDMYMNLGHIFVNKGSFTYSVSEADFCNDVTRSGEQNFLATSNRLA